MLFVRKHFLGIDLGDGEVKAVLLRKKTRGWRVEQLFRFPVTGDEEAARAASRDEALRQIARSTALRAPITTLGMSVRHATVKVIDLPPTDRRALGDLLHYEAQQHLPFRPDTAEMDFDLLGRPTEDSQPVVLAACHRGVMNECLSALRAGGLRPRVVDVGSLGAANCFANRPGVTEIAEPEGVLLVDIGAERTAMTVLRGGGFYATRSVSFGSQSLTDAMAEDFDVSPGEAEDAKRAHGVAPPTDLAAQGTGETPNIELWLDRLAAEIRLVVQSYRAGTRKGQITRILLTGGGALAAGLPEALSRRLRLEVFVPSPWTAFELTPGLEVTPDTAAPLAVATGLALRGDRALVDVNLARVSSRKAVAAGKNRARAALAVAVATGLLLGAGLYARSRLGERREGLQALQRELLKYKPLESEAKRGPAMNLREVSRRTALSRHNGQLWLELLLRFSTDLPEGVWLDEAHFDTNGIVSLRGVAETSRAVAEAVSRLRRMAHFDDVKLTYANIVKRGEESVVQFQTVCTIARGEGVGS